MGYMCILKAMEEEFTLEFASFEKFYSSSDADCPPYPTSSAPSDVRASRPSVSTRSSMAV